MKQPSLPVVCILPSPSFPLRAGVPCGLFANGGAAMFLIFRVSTLHSSHHSVCSFQLIPFPHFVLVKSLLHSLGTAGHGLATRVTQWDPNKWRCPGYCRSTVRDHCN